MTDRDRGDDEDNDDTSVEASDPAPTSEANPVSVYPDAPEESDASPEHSFGTYRDDAGAHLHTNGSRPDPDVEADADLDDEMFGDDPDGYAFDFATPVPVGSGPVQGDLLIFDDPAAVEPYRRRPMSRAERRRRVKLQARRVRRIIRHVEPWSVLKISLFFYACLWVILLVAGFMIWGVADSSGTIERLESLIVDLFQLDQFTIDAGQVFQGYALAGLALAIAGTTFNVLMCLLFNLISDLTGGLRITMIEEETARPMPSRRVRRRRPPVRR